MRPKKRERPASGPVVAVDRVEGLRTRTANIATYQPMSQRPQAINQTYLIVSWNNKQAHGCRGA